MASMLSWGDEAMEEEENSSPEKDYGMTPEYGPQDDGDLPEVVEKNLDDTSNSNSDDYNNRNNNSRNSNRYNNNKNN